MIRRPPRSTQSRSSAASDVYKRQAQAGDAPTPTEPLDASGASLVADTFRTGTERFLTGAELAGVESDELVVRTGMRSGYLEPVLRDGEVVAVLTVVSRVPRSRAIGGVGELAKLLAAEASTTLALADLVRCLLYTSPSPRDS